MRRSRGSWKTPWSTLFRGKEAVAMAGQDKNRLADQSRDPQPEQLPRRQPFRWFRSLLRGGQRNPFDIFFRCNMRTQLLCALAILCGAGVAHAQQWQAYPQNGYYQGYGSGYQGGGPGLRLLRLPPDRKSLRLFPAESGVLLPPRELQQRVLQQRLLQQRATTAYQTAPNYYPQPNPSPDSPRCNPGRRPAPIPLT